MPSHDRAAILLLAGTLTMVSVACSRASSLRGADASPQPVIARPTPIAAASPPDTLQSETTQTRSSTLTAKDAYERGLDAAYSAALLSESAVSADDWQLVISRWQEAIALLRKVPAQSTFAALTKPKIAEYQRNLGIARQQASLPRPSAPTSITIATAPQSPVEPLSPSPDQTSKRPSSVTSPKTNTATQRVFQVPVKRRAGKTPVVEVTFNGSQVFEMIIDTGASGTVITEEMAQSLGVEPEGEIIADTAGGKGIKFSTTTVQSIAVGGAVAKNVPVAIGGPDLELGLLGQDFFGNYDVWIRQNVVEFHHR